MCACYHLFYIATVLLWDWYMEVVLMIESTLLIIIYLLFFGLIGLAIINVALVIALAIMVSKQQ